jgi:hypothetical protein
MVRRNLSLVLILLGAASIAFSRAAQPQEMTGVNRTVDEQNGSSRLNHPLLNI